MLLSSVAYWDILIIFELCDFVYTECDLFVALHLIDILHLFSKDFLSCKYRGFASEPVAYLYFWYPEVWTDMEAHFQPTNNLSSSNNVQTVLSQTSTIPIRFCEINIEWKKCCRSEKERERERERERESMHCLTVTNHLFLEGIAVVVIVWYFYLQLPVL